MGQLWKPYDCLDIEINRKIVTCFAQKALNANLTVSRKDFARQKSNNIKIEKSKYRRDSKHARNLLPQKPHSRIDSTSKLEDKN